VRACLGPSGKVQPRLVKKRDSVWLVLFTGNEAAAAYQKLPVEDAAKAYTIAMAPQRVVSWSTRLAKHGLTGIHCNPGQKDAWELPISEFARHIK